ncbi:MULTISPECIES: P-loop NTPase fold protein [unclassified Rhizobium]|uniref:P-loop NTPase fold protein n=1 Tax=unclassified Rhizobium TaxID=2613769 RepID=UPI001C82F674|nr:MULTISPECIES: P-loop NTPase fold protein [unclassified Rhizobium]MBX5164435.1 hypothetical protein [Rhizobium sp. NZLR4b]MBX5208426.1 hypothetical protein [Rhizobium sp. NZLR11]
MEYLRSLHFWGRQMEGRTWATVSELKADKVSASIRKVLEGMTPSRHFPQQPTADISSYVEQVLRLGQKEADNSHGFVFKYLEKAIGTGKLLSVIRPPVRSPTSMRVSLGLSAAFDDAFAIRRQTGGKDDFIGARHVLVSLITSQKRIVAEELGMAMQVVKRTDLNALLMNLTPILLNSLEPNESLEQWVLILRDRGYADAAQALGASSAEQKSVNSKSPLTASVAPASSAQASTSIERADGLRSPTHQLDPIARLRNDDPRSLEQQDIVGIDDAAEALARVIASKNFRPPLAVGVFGHWGSGKSFLMRRIEQEIAVLRNLQSPAFHSQIVEVPFNAWHYVDTSLWANLVGEIFETLDRRSPPKNASRDGILNRLTTARELTIASARDLAAKRQGALHAKEELRRAEADFEAKRSSISQMIKDAAGGAKAAWAAASEDPEAKKLVQGVYGQSLPEMMAQWGDPQTALNSLQKDAVVWLAIRRDIGGWRPMLSCLAIFVALLTISFWGTSVLPTDFLKKVEQFNPFLLAGSGFLVTAASWSARITRKAVLARDTVVAAVTGYKDAASKNAHVNEKELKAAREKLDAARLKIAAAQASLGEAISSQANAANELARDTPAERLRAFVKSKAGVDGPYRSQQGLIGTIRRDFADLSNLMYSKTDHDASGRTEADENFEKDIQQLRTDFPDVLTPDEIETLRGGTISMAEVERLDRIVLYIDDLDRCPPDKVIDVLQAVHLLMAFPLFVVIVAVDVRWLETALKDRHKQFEGEGIDLKALEYLEKIFQLAIWTQKFDADDIGQLIRNRLAGSERGRASEQSTDAQRGGVLSNGASSQNPLPIDTSPETKNSVDSPENKLEGARPPVNELLTITDEEIEFLERTCRVLEMTPRRVLRLINSYQVARAALDQKNFDELVSKKGYRAFAGLFALATAKPDHIHQIVSALGPAKDWAGYREALRNRDAVGALSEFEDWSKVLEAEGVDLPSLRAYVALTLRFSFVGPCRTRSDKRSQGIAASR